MGRKDNTLGINKIEVDEKTNEPKIVEIEADLSEGANDPADKKIKKSKQPKKNSIGKQLVMTRILGITEDDKKINHRQKVYKTIFTVIFIVFVLAVLAWTFYNDFFSPDAERPQFSWESIAKTLNDNWYFFLLAFFALFMSYFLKGLKLSVICRSQTKKWHFKTCFETGIIGHYYNNVTPLAVGGQPFEIYHLAKHGVHGGVASSMPIVAFFLNQFAFVVMGIVFLALFNTRILILPDLKIDLAIINPLAIIGLVLCMTMPTLVIVFSLFPIIGEKMVRAVVGIGAKFKIIKNPHKAYFKTMKSVIHNAKCIKKFAKNPLALISSFLISAGEVVAQCSIAYFCLRSFGYLNQQTGGFMEWLEIVQVCVILYSAISFIPTPGNSGAADLSFYLLFSFCLTSGLAFPSMMVWRILSYYSYIIIGFIFVTMKKKSDHRKEYPEY